jgi:excisionase family DNA binding protein
MLGVSVYTIRRLVASGEVIAVNVGTRRLVRATEIDRIVQRGVGRARPTKTNRKER